MKQTAVEWLIEQIIKVDKTIHPDNLLFHKAKKMEKEQTIDFLRWFDMQAPLIKAKYTFSELYKKFYKETYKLK